VIDGNIKALCLIKNEEIIDDDVMFGFLKNILNEFFKKYTRDFIDKAPNFSLRDFVPVLKKEMHDFQKSKDKNKNLTKYRSFTERRISDDDLKQTFISRTIGI